MWCSFKGEATAALTLNCLWIRFGFCRIEGLFYGSRSFKEQIVCCIVTSLSTISQSFPFIIDFQGVTCFFCDWPQITDVTFISYLIMFFSIKQVLFADLPGGCIQRSIDWFYDNKTIKLCLGLQGFRPLHHCSQAANEISFVMSFLSGLMVMENTRLQHLRHETCFNMAAVTEMMQLRFG